MSPCSWGSEPTSMEIDGETVTVCHEEVVASLAFINSLTEAQRMAEVRRYLNDTYVTWAGGIEDDSAFYAREKVRVRPRPPLE